MIIQQHTYFAMLYLSIQSSAFMSWNMVVYTVLLSITQIFGTNCKSPFNENVVASLWSQPLWTFPREVWTVQSVNESKADFSFPFNSKVKDHWYFTSIPPIQLHGGVLRCTDRFTLYCYPLNMSDIILPEFTSSVIWSVACDITVFIYFTYLLKRLKR